MLCYRDMTFCTYYKDCKNAGVCGRALTPLVKEAAAKWWGQAPDPAPIAVFGERPSCHEPIKREEEGE